LETEGSHKEIEDHFVNFEFHYINSFRVNYTIVSPIFRAPTRVSLLSWNLNIKTVQYRDLRLRRGVNEVSPLWDVMLRPHNTISSVSYACTKLYGVTSRKTCGNLNNVLSVINS